MRDEMKKVPRLRFRGFQEDWELCKVKDFLIESKIKGSNGKIAKKLTVKLWRKGIVAKEEVYEGSLATQYYVRKSGQFMYGKLDFLNQAFGIVPIELDGYESTVDSPSFDFKPLVDSVFFLEYVSLEKFYKYQGNIANGSRKAKRIHVETFFNMPLPTPSYKEQQKIGTLFKQLDDTITLHQRKLDQLKELKKAYLQVMFPVKDERVPKLRFADFEEEWELCKFGVTNSYFTDGNYGESYPSADELSDKLNGVPFLRGCNLKNGRLVEEDANYITPEKHAELTSGHLELDDIVVAVRGSLGALGYAGQENVGWNINSQLAIIRTDKSELKGQFLIQYLLSSKGQKELLSRNTGTALKQLPIKQLKDVPVPIPIIDEQDKIGSFFVNLDTTITLHQNKLNQLKSLKKSYLQNMFI
ncbi:restriction endonuclease subunit S [Enterococcus faecalis]|nr:restriction endonuclease subunit S [Enterococcus faecalis]NSU83367.1 restriction endonuclease subunit S [Enterococcus faecalis]